MTHIRPAAIPCLLALSWILLGGPLEAQAMCSEAWCKAGPFEASPAELLEAAQAVEASDDQPVILLLQEYAYRWDEEGRQTQTFRQIYHVRGEAAVDGWGISETTWAPWFQARPDLRVRVISPEGEEQWLEGADITDAAVSQVDPTLFTDDRVLRAPLPGMGVGVVVEEVIEYRDEQPFFEGGRLGRLAVGNYIDTRLFRVTLEAPKGTPLQWRVEGIEAREKPIRTRETRGVLLEVEDLAPFGMFPPALPPDHCPYPFVEFTTAESWADVATTYHDLTQAATSLGAPQPLVEEVLQGDPDRAEKIHRAMAIARDRIRYTGVEFGQQAIVPYAPVKSLDRGYGDCKDKAALLVSLLAAADIEAHLALLSFGPDTDISADMPGLNHFDHAIVHVPGTPAMWLDPTSEFLPGDTLPYWDQNRLALVIAPGTTDLTRTPMSTPEQNLYREERDIRIPVDGLSHIIERTRVLGWPAEGLRWDFTDAEPEAIQENLENYAQETYLATTLTDWSVTDARDLSTPLEIMLETHDALVAAAEDGQAFAITTPIDVLEYAPGWLTEPWPEDTTPLAEREVPVATHPHRVEVAYRIELADGYRVGELPDSRIRQYAGALLEERYEHQDRVVLCTYVFELPASPLPPDQAAALRKAVGELMNAAPVELVFDLEPEWLLAQNEIARSLESYRELVERNPDEATYRAMYASALMESGLGEPAHAEALKAVEIDPDNGVAWRYLAWIRMHDVAGRPLAWPFDRDGAIEALERATELDPDDHTASRNLGVLLERDDHGNRFGAGVDLERATEIFATRRERSELGDMDVNLMTLQFRLGRLDELRETAETSPEQQVASVLLVAALALEDGKQAAVTEASNLSVSPTEQGQLLLAASGELMKIGKYGEASELLLAATTGSSNPMLIRERARKLAELRPLEELAQSTEGPAAPVYQLMSRASGTPPPLEELRDLFAADTYRRLKEHDQLQSAFGIPDSATTAVAASEMSTKVALEIGLGMAEVHVDGNDDLGYEVRIHWAQEGGHSQTCYVVKEGGRYRIRAMAELPQFLAAEAVRRLDRKDVDGARQWLDWAAESGQIVSETTAGSGGPFSILWQDVDEPDAERIRLAAAALLLDIDPKRATATLEEARGSLEDLDERIAVEHALWVAAELAEDHERTLEITERLVELDPENIEMKGLHIQMLIVLERLDEAQEAADALLAAHPDEQAALGLSTMVALASGESDRAQQILRDMLAKGFTEPGTLNLLAWLLCFDPATLEEAVQLAVRANTSGTAHQGNILHTLATAQAQLGHSQEAHEVMVFALDQPGSPTEVERDWWFVVGRLAEVYGLQEYAKEAYGRVSEDEIDPLSTYELARRRLEALGGR